MKLQGKEINVGDFLYVGTEKAEVIEILDTGQPIIKWDNGNVNRNLPFSWLTLKPAKDKLLTELQIKLLEKYSEFLEQHGYMDADWWAEEPKAIKRFIDSLKTQFK